MALATDWRAEHAAHRRVVLYRRRHLVRQRASVDSQSRAADLREIGNSSGSRERDCERGGTHGTAGVTVTLHRNRLVRKPVDEVVHTELVGLIGFVDGPESCRGELPEIGHVSIEVDDGEQTLRRIVTFEDATQDWL